MAAAAREALALLALILVASAIATVPGGAAFARQAGGEATEADGAAAGKMRLPEPPTLALEAIPAYGYAPLTVGFIMSAVDPQGVGFRTYKWNFGDGHFATLPPTLTFNTYTKPGAYVVTVTAVTTDGRIASAFTGVVVKPRSIR